MKKILKKIQKIPKILKKNLTRFKSLSLFLVICPSVKITQTCLDYRFPDLILVSDNCIENLLPQCCNKKRSMDKGMRDLSRDL